MADTGALADAQGTARGCREDGMGADGVLMLLTVADVESAADHGAALTVSAVDALGRRRTFTAPRRTLLAALAALVRHEVDVVRLCVEPWRFVERISAASGPQGPTRER